MGVIVALIVGLLVGAIAKVIMPGRDPGGLLITALLGVAGSVVAFLVGSAVGWYGPGGDAPGVIASVLGALVVLAGYRAIVGRA
jgi:uncharacterized membrane protein YeaQ/YmgE (transglycosylase-associated protein family)